MTIHTPKYLNKQMDILEEKGYSTPFATEYAKQSFGIIGNNDRIISRADVNARRLAKFGEKAIEMTKEEYDNALKEINAYLNDYKGGATAVKMESRIRENLIERASDIGEIDFDFSKLSTKDIYDAYREAARRQEKDYGRQKGTNDTFFEYLLDVLEEYSE